MTSIRDYLASIRTSLDEIENGTDGDEEPGPSLEIYLRKLDVLADYAAMTFGKETPDRCGEQILEAR